MTVILADVSEFQKVIDWTAYGAANPAVIVRVHNSYRADNYAKANIAGARAHTQWRAFYQYLTAGADPVKAAHDFQATTGPLLPGEVAILDLEEGTGDQRARRAAWLNALHDPVEWVYSGLYFARAHLPGVKVEWLAAYGQAEPTDVHALWQFTNARKFAGIPAACDASLFHGTLAQLQALSGVAPVVSRDNTRTYLSPVRGPFPLPVGKAFTVGSKGWGVHEIQVLTGASPDGIFGPQTAAHVRVWTVAHGPYPTSIVNAQVWAHMSSYAGK